MTPAPFTARQKRNAVIGVLLAMFLATLDQTIVAPALPTIGARLGDADFLPWIVTAYLLTSTAVTPLYGKVSDIYGRQPVLFLALGIFVLGSIICALAGSMAALIIGRAVQGLGGGGLITLAQTVIADVVSPRERSKFVVYISTVWAVSSISGPALGGVLAGRLSWTLMFWINLPLAALAALISWRTLRGAPQVLRDHRLDLLGSLLITLATLGFMLALTLGGERIAWTSPALLGLLAASLLLGAWLYAHLKRSAHPLIPLSLFRNEVVGMATLAIFFAMFAFIGATVYLPIYFEYVLRVDPTFAGVGLVALLGGSVIGANSTGRYMPRVAHYKQMATYGLIVAFGALLLLALLAPRLNYWGAEALVLALGIGIGPLFPTATVCVQNAVDPRDLGIATATLAFLRTLGSAVGVALLGAILLGYRVIADNGAPPQAIDAELVARAAQAFSVIFAVQAAMVALSFFFYWRMEERPLRGPSAATASAEL